MIKVVNFLNRKPGWSVEEFQGYWRSTHSKFVLRIPELKGYVQCHTLQSGYRREPPPPVEGIEEIYFETMEQPKSLENHPALRAVRDDLAKFIDLPRFHSLLAEEIVIKSGRTSGEMVKSIEFVRKKPDMPIPDFHRYWVDVHGPLAAKIGMIKKYIQSHTLLGEYQKETPPPYGGIAETWFENTAAMRETARTPEYQAVREDEKKFTSGERMFIITREIRVF
jgi:uncharacterized protein (TIGR02118 family)